VKRIRSGTGRARQQPRIGAPDRSLTPNAGLAAVAELCGRLGVIEALDAAVGPVKQRARGFGAGELLAGLAAAQLAGEDFLAGLDRQRADAAGQQLAPVPGLASTTAAGLASARQERGPGMCDRDEFAGQFPGACGDSSKTAPSRTRACRSPDALRFVPFDFESGGSWVAALREAGFDPARPAVVALTGITQVRDTRRGPADHA
jgi:hypothetical protein